jgi:hypothetical protein
MHVCPLERCVARLCRYVGAEIATTYFFFSFSTLDSSFIHTTKFGTF